MRGRVAEEESSNEDSEVASTHTSVLQSGGTTETGGGAGQRGNSTTVHTEHNDTPKHLFRFQSFREGRLG